MHKSNLRVVNNGSPSKTLRELKSQLRAVGWMQQVEYILEASGKNVAEVHFMKADAEPAPGTLLNLSGVPSISKFIEQIPFEPSVATIKQRWQDCITAYYCKINFSINSTDLDEILAQFSDVTTALGREPWTMNEFQTAKESLMSDKIKKLKNSLERASSDYDEAQTQIKKAEADKIEAKKEVASLQKQNAHTESLFNDAIKRLELTSSVLQEKESELESAKDKLVDLQAKLNESSELINQIGPQPFIYQTKLEKLKKEATSKISRASKLIQRHMQNAKTERKRALKYKTLAFVNGVIAITVISAVIIRIVAG